MPFGAHQGKKLCNVPPYYLIWLYENNWRFSEMEFHSNWQWQIPVYSKLAKMMIKEKLNYIEGGRFNYFMEEYQNAILNNKPLSGFEILVENIKWLKKIK